MKKIPFFICLALTVPNVSVKSAYAETDEKLWEKFVKYDLCIDDYSSLAESEKELCRFIFDTEQSSKSTVICERTRRMLAHDRNIGDRISTELLNDSYGIWDKYSPFRKGDFYCIHCVPDIKYLDGQDDFNEYWTDDAGSTKVLFRGENSGSLFDGQYRVTGEGGIDEIAVNPAKICFNF